MALTVRGLLKQFMQIRYCFNLYWYSYWTPFTSQLCGPERKTRIILFGIYQFAGNYSDFRRKKKCFAEFRIWKCACIRWKRKRNPDEIGRYNEMDLYCSFM